MARTHTFNDSAERFGHAERPLRRELLTTGISLILALGVGLALFRAPGMQRRADAPVHSTLRVGATPAGAVATPAAAAAPVAPALAAGAGWAQLPPDDEIPALALRALAQTNTSASTSMLTVYLVGSQAQADELDAGLTEVNAIRATGGAPALNTATVAIGPYAATTITTVLGYWFPSQVVDLR